MTFNGKTAVTDRPKKGPNSGIPLPDFNYLWELFNYDCETGELEWAISRQGTRKGATAGTICGEGYKTLTIDGTIYRLNRIIFKMFHGHDPKGVVDHDDGNKLNNRIDNLFDITNRANSSKEKTIKSGLPAGVDCVASGKFRSRILIDGSRLFLGHYRSPDKASIAYQVALGLHHLDVTNDIIVSTIRG